MRNIPVDASQLSLIATGKVSEKAEYQNLANGGTQRTGNQATNERGERLWVIDCLVDDDEANRAEVIGVTVAASYQPVVTKFKPVQFRGVTAMVYRDNATGQPRVSLKAQSVVDSGSPVKASPAS